MMHNTLPSKEILQDFKLAASFIVPWIPMEVKDCTHSVWSSYLQGFRWSIGVGRRFKCQEGKSETKDGMQHYNPFARPSDVELKRLSAVYPKVVSSSIVPINSVHDVDVTLLLIDNQPSHWGVCYGKEPDNTLHLAASSLGSTSSSSSSTHLQKHITVPTMEERGNRDFMHQPDYCVARYEEQLPTASNKIVHVNAGFPISPLIQAEEQDALDYSVLTETHLFFLGTTQPSRIIYDDFGVAEAQAFRLGAPYKAWYMVHVLHALMRALFVEQRDPPRTLTLLHYAMATALASLAFDLTLRPHFKTMAKITTPEIERDPLPYTTLGQHVLCHLWAEETTRSTLYEMVMEAMAVKVARLSALQPLRDRNVTQTLKLCDEDRKVLHTLWEPSTIDPEMQALRQELYCVLGLLTYWKLGFEKTHDVRSLLQKHLNQLPPQHNQGILAVQRKCPLMSWGHILWEIGCRCGKFPASLTTISPAICLIDFTNRMMRSLKEEEEREAQEEKKKREAKKGEAVERGESSSATYYTPPTNEDYNDEEYDEEEEDELKVLGHLLQRLEIMTSPEAIDTKVQESVMQHPDGKVYLEKKQTAMQAHQKQMKQLMEWRDLALHHLPEPKLPHDAIDFSHSDRCWFCARRFVSKDTMMEHLQHARTQKDEKGKVGTPFISEKEPLKEPPKECPACHVVPSKGLKHHFWHGTEMTNPCWAGQSQRSRDVMQGAFARYEKAAAEETKRYQTIVKILDVQLERVKVIIKARIQEAHIEPLLQRKKELLGK